MRQLDKDEAPGLGKKIEQPKMPEQHKHVGNGVWKKPDGTMETHRPLPPPYGIPSLRP
jgi:hypothetical protein